MLADRLGQLCDAGLVSRTVTEGPPLSVTYALTDAGRALLPALEQITRWSDGTPTPTASSGRSRRSPIRRLPSEPDDHTAEVKLKDQRGRLRLPAYILIAMTVVLATTMWLTVVLLAASR